MLRARRLLATQRYLRRRFSSTPHLQLCHVKKKDQKLKKAVHATVQDLIENKVPDVDFIPNETFSNVDCAVVTVDAPMFYDEHELLKLNSYFPSGLRSKIFGFTLMKPPPTDESQPSDRTVKIGLTLIRFPSKSSTPSSDPPAASDQTETLRVEKTTTEEGNSNVTTFFTTSVEGALPSLPWTDMIKQKPAVLMVAHEGYNRNENALGLLVRRWDNLLGDRSLRSTVMAEAPQMIFIGSSTHVVEGSLLMDELSPDARSSKSPPLASDQAASKKSTVVRGPAGVGGLLFRNFPSASDFARLLRVALGDISVTPEMSAFLASEAAARKLFGYGTEAVRLASAQFQGSIHVDRKVQFENLPLFMLPDEILIFPGEIGRNLNVFEPRNRLLVRESLFDKKPFGIVVAHGRLGVSVQPYFRRPPEPNGCCEVVLRGLRRFRVDTSSMTNMPGYFGLQQARVTYFDDAEMDPDQEAFAAQKADRVAKLLADWLGVDITDSMMRRMPPSTVSRSFWFANVLPAEYDFRLTWYTMTDTMQRLESQEAFLSGPLAKFKEKGEASVEFEWVREYTRQQILRHAKFDPDSDLT